MAKTMKTQPMPSTTNVVGANAQKTFDQILIEDFLPKGYDWGWETFARTVFLALPGVDRATASAHAKVAGEKFRAEFKMGKKEFLAFDFKSQESLNKIGTILAEQMAAYPNAYEAMQTRIVQLG